MSKQLILMVDDELDNRVMMRYFLESWGYEVELAANGEEALAKVLEQRPALILLDLEMPVMDGFEACKQLKSDPDTETIPVIMFTGLEATSDKVKGIRDGADDYVVKTVDPEEIRARIEMILRRSQRYQRPTASENGNGDSAVLSGSLEDKSFPEAFQLAMAYGESGTLVLRNSGEIGNVFLVDGDAVHAEYGELEGEDAFYELALWDKGQFSYKVGESSPKRTIEAKGQSLLMEATRRMDEWNLISSKIPNFDVVPHRAASSAKEPIRLTKADWKVLSQVDGEKTLRQLSEALGTDPHETGRVVFGLLTAGVVAFEADKLERDAFFDAVPELRDEPKGDEPFELSSGAVEAACLHRRLARPRYPYPSRRPFAAQDGGGLSKSSRKKVSFVSTNPAAPSPRARERPPQAKLQQEPEARSRRFSLASEPSVWTEDDGLAS